MVAFAVLVILSSVLIVSSNSANRRFDLDSAAQYLVSNIRLVQGKALAPDSLAGSGIYGIYFPFQNPYDNYILFEDKDGNNLYSGSLELIKEIKLPKNVYFSSIWIDELQQTSSVSLIFKPPLPTVIINNQSDKNTLKVVVAKAGQLSKNIIVETSNNVEIQ